MLLSLTALQTALEVGAIYSLVALALFISFSILNIADLSTDGCYTLGFAVGATVTLAGHPLLALPAAAAEADAPYAEDGDMDYIPLYRVTVDPREDGSADITYEIDWQVIDGGRDDYLSWAGGCAGRMGRGCSAGTLQSLCRAGRSGIGRVQTTAVSGCQRELVSDHRRDEENL